MEFKKCIQCGSFFASTEDICYNCKSKDNNNIYKLKSYLELYENVDSIETISEETGIPISSLTSYLSSQELDDYSNKINLEL